MEIETAHATGDQVTLTSDAEILDAHCVDLLHNARAGTTVLKGNPQMRATKDGNKLFASELQLQEETLLPDKANPEGKKYQRATALGPGHIDLLGRGHQEKQRPCLLERPPRNQPRWPLRSAGTDRQGSFCR